MARENKLRTVIMHDPELDDLNTFLRYLLYSNQFETEAIIYSSSRFHWKGDGNGTLFNGESEHTPFGIGPIASWRWDEGSEFMHDAVKAYEKVYENLKIHEEGYPEPELLLSRIYNGNIEFPGDISKDSPGSMRIRELILDDVPGKLFLLTGAGHSTLARALKSIEESYKDTSEWKVLYKKICDKVLIQSFGDQDLVYANYVGPNWPDIEFREVATTIWGYFARKVALPHDQKYLSASWMREHVSSVGPFGELYMVWGDGKQMHKNDIADYFGFSNVSVEQLKAMGYIPWYGTPEEEGAWISEGDTSMYMNLIDNGLDAHIAAGYGGWGGRNGADIDQDGNRSNEYASARWFGAAQRDFAARMQWTVTPNYSEANHPPKIAVEGGDCRIVRPGEWVELIGKAVDPDHDHLIGKWWQYTEAGTYPKKLALTVNGVVTEKGDQSAFMDAMLGQSGPFTMPKMSYPFKVVPPKSPEITSFVNDSIEMTCGFKIPSDVTDGQTIHMIFEVTDCGPYAMTTYQRIVLTVERI